MIFGSSEEGNQGRGQTSLTRLMTPKGSADSQRLKAQMLLHVRGGKHDAKMKGLTFQGITAMDIGGLACPAASPAVAESSRLLAQIDYASYPRRFTGRKGRPAV